MEKQVIEECPMVEAGRGDECFITKSVEARATCPHKETCRTLLQYETEPCCQETNHLTLAAEAGMIAPLIEETIFA
jgi:hypothetical protein